MAVDSRVDDSDFKVTESQVCDLWGLGEEQDEPFESFLASEFLGCRESQGQLRMPPRVTFSVN